MENLVAERGQGTVPVPKYIPTSMRSGKGGKKMESKKKNIDADKSALAHGNLEND